ncbi:MAG TPA: NAD(P)/FAD-dependent oxidoreductase [Acidimicrobiia bacterium]
MQLYTDRIETVVIGGGQAGLATSYHMKARGLPHVVLDAGDRVGDVWRQRWDSLRLFTQGRISGLPGMAYPGSGASYPDKEEVADYLETYAARFDLPVMNGVNVNRVSPIDNGFMVEHNDGRLQTDNVIVATGSFHHPRIPKAAGGLDDGIFQMHSSSYRRPSQLQAGDVLVVGAGNSGAEIALELSDRHRVWLSGRDPGQEPTKAGSVPDRFLTPVYWFFGHHVLKASTPMGRKARDHFLNPPRGIPLGRARRKEIAAAGIERVPRTVGASEGRPLLEDGRVLDVANVIWCTGYVADYSWIDLPIFGEYGYPAHVRGIVESAPGLYFMGLMFQYSLTSPLVGGVGRDAGHIVKHIASRKSEFREPVKGGRLTAGPG